jgi:hypothetical protein
MRAREFVLEKWSRKYKSNIDCSNPQGFSQKAHCAGRKKVDELSFLGSECTKDCSGHRAGYKWSKDRGGVDGNSPYSPSFNKGAALAKTGK